MAFKFHDSKGGSRVPRFVGVEIEVSTFNNPIGSLKTVIEGKWGGHVGGDGSIEGGNVALEIRTAPARGAAFYKQIREITAALRQGGGEANDSCGLHVHIDARDFDAKDLAKVALIWTGLEKKFYTAVEDHRIDSDWCNPVEDQDVWQDFNDAVQSKETQRIIDAAANLTGSDKYTSLNFSTWAAIKTLENRMHEGTVNYNEIVRWAEMNSLMVESAKKMSFEECLAKYKTLKLPKVETGIRVASILKKRKKKKVVEYSEDEDW